MIGAATGIASLVGMWYMLQAEIQEAKELPKICNIYDQEYPSRQKDITGLVLTNNIKIKLERFKRIWMKCMKN